ncbi:somatostatin receptor type 4-like [Panulirus ornatus]|uniref:somatostatin receptor type 4-like n=1 Tax=Panulirus ornatus TaxID=150431 RepID=UPI003A857026
MEDYVDCSVSSVNCTETENVFEDRSVSMGNIFQCVVISVCMLVVLVGIGAVAILVVVRRRLQTVANFYILNFALSCIINILMTPLYVIIRVQWNFVLGWVLCFVTCTIGQIGILTNSFFLMFLSIDCYIATRQQHHSRNYRWKMLKVVTALVWIASALFIVPIYYTTENSESICVEGPIYHRNLMLKATSVFAVFFLPFILMWIYVALSFPPESVRTTSSSADGEREPLDSSVIEYRRLLVALSVAFTVCQLPYWLYQVISPLHTFINIYVIFLSFIHINMAVNSILIIVYSRDIRRELSLCLPSRASRMLDLETL